MKRSTEIILLGGSAGSLPVLINILKELPSTFDIPVVVIIHRLKNVVSEMDKILSFHTANKKVIEPEDKEMIKGNCIYLAPQNYHLLIEADRSISLDYSEAIQYSRPSIDVTFESAADVYGKGVVAILLSGTNSDGTAGIKKVLDKKGTAIIQDPATAEYSFMPQNAIDHNKEVKILAPDAITKYLQSLM
jgi:two-component system, chemotaxis family, protein-glutamate methylesterase/glutaminase